jgi:hypothetical protein
MPLPCGLSRRRFLGGLAALAPWSSQVPVRAITKRPGFHWFGYYDKRQFDPTGRYVLGMEVDFEHRSPQPADRVRLGMMDLKDGDRWIPLAETSAWNWQQGCMLQWLPGSDREVIYNDRQGDRHASVILDVRSGRKRTLPAPIYALSPDGRWAVTTDFRRLAHTRPGYGYSGIPDPNRDVAAPEDAGIWRVDLRTGQTRLIISIAQIARMPSPPSHPQLDGTGATHWFNHLLVSPDGRRFIFLHRWKGGAAGNRFLTRMFTADPDGKNLHLVDGFGGVSHFIWRDARHILSWANRPPLGGKFYLFEDQSDRVEPVGPDVMTRDGHCSYLPGNRWILNDTYPDKERQQHLYLYDTATGRHIPLASFYSPPEYAGEWRYDLHPRFSPDGRFVTVDSAHQGGRQIYLVDLRPVIG